MLTTPAPFAVSPNLSKSFEEAFVRLPSSFRGSASDGEVSGTLSALRSARPELFATGPTLPVIVVLPGSSERGVGKRIADLLCETLGVAVVALNSHAVPGRPAYTSPASDEVYDQVHALRLAEIDHFVARLHALGFVDPWRMALLGVSEGAVAAAMHRDPIFSLRIVAAWPIEPTYFHRRPLLGGDATTAFLNLVGWQDEYFGTAARPGLPRGGAAHGAAMLSQRPGSKVVIVPDHGHHLIETSPVAADEIRCFVKGWLDRQAQQ